LFRICPLQLLVLSPCSSSKFFIFCGNFFSSFTCTWLDVALRVFFDFYRRFPQDPKPFISGNTPMPVCRSFFCPSLSLSPKPSRSPGSRKGRSARTQCFPLPETPPGYLLFSLFSPPSFFLRPVTFPFWPVPLCKQFIEACSWPPNPAFPPLRFLTTWCLCQPGTDLEASTVFYTALRWPSLQHC